MKQVLTHLTSIGELHAFYVFEADVLKLHIK